jgi:hypothetical protein
MQRLTLPVGPAVRADEVDIIEAVAALRDPFGRRQRTPRAYDDALGT